MRLFSPPNSRATPNVTKGGSQMYLQIPPWRHPYPKSGKECVKAVYCHPAYLTYMQSTS